VLDTRGTKPDKDRDVDKDAKAPPALNAVPGQRYPAIKGDKLFTGEDGVPVDDVIRYLRKEGKILF
jgi:hypothetical protein